MKKTLLMLAVAALAIGANAQTTKTPPMKTTAPMKKTMPMRDPKTGRYMKKPVPPASKMHAKGTMKKTMPARDPQTGRFIKKKG